MTMKQARKTFKKLPKEAKAAGFRPWARAFFGKSGFAYAGEAPLSPKLARIVGGRA